ncbi:MAG: universal stress protein [Gemmatimonadales bacterium]|nr:MAG: universal stress protein [Gemmatimonadales bacterium]
MYQKILIGIDFSDISEESVCWAVSRFPKAEIVLFHAIEQVTIPGYLRRELGVELDVKLEAELDVLANLEAIAERVGIKPEFEIRRGWTPTALTGAADDLEAELIIVGAHQKRVWQTDELGNMCRAVVRKSQLPVLIWRPIRNQKDKTILAALSLRDEGAPVAHTAAAFADYFSTRLVLLHAMPGTLQGYLRAVSSPAKVKETLRRIEAGARLDVEALVPPELRERLSVKTVVARGRPIVTHVLNTAEAENVDLIVIGKAHAPDLASRVLIGSVTSQVITGANCSVLTVPL